jgi:hypothetical protein
MITVVGAEYIEGNIYGLPTILIQSFKQMHKGRSSVPDSLA